MADFMIRFLICNLFISVIVGVLLTAKYLLRNILSSRMQYHLWFLLLGLLAIPFIPFRLSEFFGIFSRLASLYTPALPYAGSIIKQGSAAPMQDLNWLNDFTVSVSRGAPSITGNILLGIWLSGIFIMILLTAKSTLFLKSIKKSALPLQNPAIRRLYYDCKNDLHITKKLPIYSTAFLKSPVIAGFLRPCIYLPIHLISDYSEPDMEAACKTSCHSYTTTLDRLRPIKYMLLHELQHYKHKDILIGYLTTIAKIVYWFNPIIWYALREMQNDREVACDTSVLKLLTEDSYIDYGNTLINFAEKLSHPVFPFAASLSGSMKQTKRRILNIALYEKPNRRKQLAGIVSFLMITVLILGFVPLLSANAAEYNYKQWDTSSKNISLIDLSSHFKEYQGSFVLYDMAADAWSVYDMEHASLRVSPNSTYKIYDALFGLEAGVITPEDSFMKWSGQLYPFQAWNVDQTLPSAMKSSVNWYFQGIDQQLGASAIDHYIHEIGYGNENIDGGLSSYWMEASLKISPVEQVELLRKFYENSLGFSTKNINAVKDSILLSSSEAGRLYGKTGTGCIDGMDINGWFVGYVETHDNTWFFAANIASNNEATGSNAAKITLDILSQMNIWD